jgi:hypothetical protein
VSRFPIVFGEVRFEADAVLVDRPAIHDESIYRFFRQLYGWLYRNYPSRFRKIVLGHLVLLAIMAVFQGALGLVLDPSVPVTAATSIPVVAIVSWIKHRQTLVDRRAIVAAMDREYNLVDRERVRYEDVTAVVRRSVADDVDDGTYYFIRFDADGVTGTAMFGLATYQDDVPKAAIEQAFADHGLAVEQGPPIEV